MFKKILGLILCVATVASMVTTPAFAAKESEWKQDALSGLGVYQENPVTYDGFITSVAGFFYDDLADMGSAEIFARSMGMIESDEEYKGQDTLTVGAALKIAVTALGYKAVLGTDGNYVKKAAELGISKGISGNSGAKLKASTAAGILYEMIDVSPLVRTFNGKNGGTYEIAEDETILSMNRDIYEVKGLLTGTETTSLYGTAGCAKEDCIIIEGVTYYVGDARYDEFLGKYVMAFAKETDDTLDTALYVGEIEGRNRSLFIEGKNITNINFVGNNRISQITYQETKTRRKTVDMVASPIVIYNGMYLYPYYRDTFTGKDLELIDYNSDKKYDIIKITAYQNVIVEAVDSSEMIIKNRNRYSGLPEVKLNLLEDSNLKVRIFDGNGTEINFSAIKVDDVLSVAISGDGKVIDIYVSDNAKMAGTITGINNIENIVLIDNEEYETTADFRRFLAASGKTLQVGELYTFYFDYTGKIAYIKEKTVNDYNVLTKVGYDVEKNEYYAVHMDINGDWYTTPISPKVSRDGYRTNLFEDDMENLKNELKEDPQIVIFKYNSKNQIIYIDTADEFRANEDGENAVFDNDSAFCSVRGDYLYCGGKYFESTSGTIIYPESDAKVIVIPTEGRNTKENWEIFNVGSFFKTDATYTIEYFNPDPFGFTDLFVVESVPAGIGMSDSLYVVTGKKQILVDGEEYTQIEGTVDGFINLSFLGSKSNSFNYGDGTAVKLGDVINFELDDEGKIKTVEKVYSLDRSFEDLPYTTLNNHGHHGKAINAGKIKRLDYEAGKMVVQIGANQIPFRVNPNMQVTVYNGKEGCLSKPFSSLNQDNKILIRTTWGNVDEIVCAKN